MFDAFVAFKLELAIIALNVTKISATSVSCEADILPDRYLAVKEMASNICRSASYCLTVPASTPAIYSCFSFPHRTAWKWVASEQSWLAEAQWCTEVSQCMQLKLPGRVAEDLVDQSYGTVV